MPYSVSIPNTWLARRGGTTSASGVVPGGVGSALVDMTLSVIWPPCESGWRAWLTAPAVLLFAAVGRLSHAEGLDAGRGARGGLAVPGRRRRRHPGRPHLATPGGADARALAVWVGTLVGGMLLRALTGGGVQLSFVIVAAIVLAVLLLGWRLVTRAASAVRPARRASEKRPADVRRHDELRHALRLARATTTSVPGATSRDGNYRYWPVLVTVSIDRPG